MARGPAQQTHRASPDWVLQHLIELPIRILNQPVPKFIKKGDTRGVQKWQAQTRLRAHFSDAVQDLIDRPCGSVKLGNLVACDDIPFRLLKEVIEKVA